MGVKIADKLEQYNQGTYYLVDSSAVEYVDKDGTVKSVKDVLDNAPTDESTHKTTIFENHIDMGKYLLLAKITNANYANNIIKFSCPNYKGANDVGFKYEKDMDIYKFELHFNTGSRRENNGYGITLKQHGLGLYSYPLNNPQNTEPRIEESIRLYWDYSKGEIYVFLVDMMTAIPHCVLEYTGSGTLLRKDTFVMDDLYNRREGINGTWEDSKWKSIPYNKLEIPPIHELGGGSAEGMTTYTSLDALGLTAPITVGEIFNAMPNKTMAVIACEAKDETEGTVTISDIPESFGVLTIKKSGIGRFSIDYQNSLFSSSCNVKRWIGTLKGTDGTGLYWKQLSAEPTFVTLSDIGLTKDATFQDVVDALPKGSSALLGVKDFTNYQTIFPYEEGNDQFARVYIVKGLDDGSCMYARWFRKDGVKEAIAIFNLNDNKFNGWSKVITENSDPYACTSYNRLTGTEDLFTLPCGHYASTKADTTYNYPVTDSSNVTAHIYVLGCLNEPANNKGYRIILYFDNKNRMYRINEWWGSFRNGWQKIQTENWNVITADTITKYGTEILKYPVGTWSIDSVNLGKQFTDLPLTGGMAGVIEIDSIYPNKSPYEHSYGYRNYTFKDALTTNIYVRTLNSGDTVGTMQRDTGWKKVCTDETRLTTVETQVSELFQSVSNGKKSVANAITGKGVSTSTTATFATMATNISKIKGYKEETKRQNVPRPNESTTTAIFSANVLGIKEVIPPSDDSYIVSEEMFRIEGKEVSMRVSGEGTWQITALIEA